MDSRRPRAVGTLGATAMAMIIATLVWRSWLLRTRTFDPDEMQHLHVAWSLSQGLVPYRDFFEHHAPGLALLLAPLVGAFDTAHSFDAVVQAMSAARAAMLLFAGLTVAATWKVADLAHGRETAWIAAALLSVSMVFVGRSLEVRPDVPAVACWVASLVALGLATRRAGSPVAGRYWFLSGILLGLAIVFTQKLLLAGPGLAVASIIHVAAGRSGADMRSTARRVTSLLAGFAIPLGVTGLYFASRAAFWPLVDSTLFVNLGWHVEVTPTKTLRWLATRDPWLCAFGLAGLLLGATLAWRGRRARPLRLFLTCGALSLVGGLFAIPAPYPQYTLLFLPLIAVLGAAFLWRTLVWLGLLWTAGRRRTVPAAGTVLGGTVWAATVVVSLTIAAPFFRHPLVYPALGVLCVTAVAFLVRRGLLRVAAAVVLAGTSVYQVQQARWMSGLSNREQFGAMRLVHAATGLNDTVLDGFSGYGWFRPHAWFYFFLHPGVRAAIPGTATKDVYETLASASTRPAVVIVDDHLRAMIPDVPELLESHYRAVEAPGAVIWVRSGATP